MATSKYFAFPVSDLATALGFLAAVAGSVFVLTKVPAAKKALGL